MSSWLTDSSCLGEKNTSCSSLQQITGFHPPYIILTHPAQNPQNSPPSSLLCPDSAPLPPSLLVLGSPHSDSPLYSDPPPIEQTDELGGLLSSGFLDVVNSAVVCLLALTLFQPSCDCWTHTTSKPTNPDSKALQRHFYTNYNTASITGRTEEIYDSLIRENHNKIEKPNDAIQSWKGS